MDRYTKNALWLYWIRGDDEEVLTGDEFSDLEEENLREGNEIAKIFKIETDIFLFEKPLCKEFKEFNHLLWIDVDIDEKPWLEDGIWKEPTDDICYECKSFGINNDNDAIQTNLEWFDEHEPIRDDDDNIEDLDDYLILKDAPYNVDEKEEGFK
ncbi:hypothetical protein Tco_0525672 [Tanacetum coccineum]